MTTNREGESYVKVVANLAGVLFGISAIGVALILGRTGEPTEPKPQNKSAVATAAPLAEPPKPIVAIEPTPVVKSKPKPKPVIAPKPLEIDRAAVAKAEAELDSASRERERSEARLDSANRSLAAAGLQATADAQRAKGLAFNVRDPSAKIARVSARGGFLKAEKDRIKGEIATLAAAPRPNGKILSNKNPVARPSEGNEQHFELRRNRVSVIELDRLIALVKSDAQLRIRLNDGARLVHSKVGPVGAFSLEYSLLRSSLTSIESLMDRRSISYDLRGWEVVPEMEGRGESYEATSKAVSDYARTINRLNPSKSTVTFWIYPDSFALFRKLRDDLQAKGFLVAGRPLPEAMAIRGSPAGSLSAGQ